MASLPLISVVDDDDAVRESLQSFIRSVGLPVEVFASGEEFLSSNCLHSTRLLILDVRMHGLNGLELQNQLVDSRCEIPVVFITAHGDEASRLLALKNGAVAYLRKPFSEESLLSAIEAALKLQMT